MLSYEPAVEFVQDGFDDGIQLAGDLCLQASFVGASGNAASRLARSASSAARLEGKSTYRRLCLHFVRSGGLDGRRHHWDSALMAQQIGLF
jgi:hypothetical protein